MNLITGPIWGNLLGSLKAGIIGNFPLFVATVSAEVAGLVGTEAQDFDNALISLTQQLEAGTSPSVAFNNAFNALKAQAKSDALASAIRLLEDFTNFVTSITGIITSAL